MNYQYITKTMNRVDINDKTFIDCACGNEVLGIEYDRTYHSVTKNDDDKSFMISEYNVMLYQHKPLIHSFKWRIVQAWKLLIHGHFCADQLVFNSENARKLAKFINDNENK